MHTFYEFFAGGGMVRAALEPRWKCLFANDYDARKVETYIDNWGDQEIVHQDVAKIAKSDLPGQADLAWASFPCQDLSLAGAGAGLGGTRSGTFWPFWNLVKELVKDGRRPAAVVIENVVGTITSHKGADFKALVEAFSNLGYRTGAIVADASDFVPQSRKRFFIVGIDKRLSIPANLFSRTPNDDWIPSSLHRAYDSLDDQLKENWIWWNPPIPSRRNMSLDAIIEEEPKDVPWHSAEETQRLISMMSETNRRKVRNAQQQKRRLIGTAYRRTRLEADGNKVQRVEVRFDGLAGCLRTPAGGSSRQLVIDINSEIIKSRLISARETARLMGLPDNYKLPARYNEAYHLTGDGVAVPVVRHLIASLVEPILAHQGESKEVA